MKTSDWTYGAELEMSDWDRRNPVCPWLMDLKEVMLVNANGIAVDPKGETYHLGGEALTRPSATPSGVADQLHEFLRLYPGTTTNYRAMTHVHVRVPGLRDDLELLKRLQSFCHVWLAKLLSIMEPVPEPDREEYPEQNEWKGARRRWSRRKTLHQRVMPESIVKLQMKTKTPEDFINVEGLNPATGKMIWAVRPRCAVNIRQLIQTDTIEFRHSPGTICPDELESVVRWAKEFMKMALLMPEVDPIKKWRTKFADKPWPQFMLYEHWMEKRYLGTAPHLVGRDMALKNIREILKLKPGEKW